MIQGGHISCLQMQIYMLWYAFQLRPILTIWDGKEKTTKHPTIYVSGSFIGSQPNWATLTKEVYGIYRSFKNPVILSA